MCIAAAVAILLLLLPGYLLKAFFTFLSTQGIRKIFLLRIKLNETRNIECT